MQACCARAARRSSLGGVLQGEGGWCEPLGSEVKVAAFHREERLFCQVEPDVFRVKDNEEWALCSHSGGTVLFQRPEAVF